MEALTTPSDPPHRCPGSWSICPLVRSLTPAGPYLDPAGHSVADRGRSVQLTPTEYRLLAALLAQRGEVVRRRALVAAGWPDGAIVHDNTLDSYLTRLRRKLHTLATSATITTVRGVGYRLS